MTNKQYMGIRLNARKNPPDGGGTDIPKHPKGGYFKSMLRFYRKAKRKKETIQYDMYR